MDYLIKQTKNDNKKSNIKKKKTFTSVWEEEYPPKRLTTREWQKEIGNLFKTLLILTHEDLLDLHEGETGQFLAILAIYFNTIMPKKSDIDIILNKVLETISGSPDLSIEGEGIIAVLWNSNIALTKKKLSSEEYYEKLSKFFNDLSEQSQKIFPKEVGQLLAYILVIMSLEYPNPLYHYNIALSYMFKKLGNHFGNTLLRKVSNVEKKINLPEEKSNEKSLQYFI